MIWVTWRQQRALLAGAAAVVAGFALIGLLEHHGLVGALNNGSTTRSMAAFLPAALGVFWGAPLLARPLENHTADLLWPVARLRWLALSLLTLGAATLGVALAVRVVLAWVLDGRFNDHYRYDVVSVAALGFAVFAVALGAFVGAVIGRVEPAMLVTLLVYAFVRFVGGQVRDGDGSWGRWQEVRWAELGWYGAAAVLLIAGTFAVVARRGTSS
ncbi:hypothetical protein [Cryptosporangium arvum]|uniref:hypothetical protein n=1 Tax=Cryptosporangium arvum TaxID=80871 RepID=UPI0004B0E245|nr:hypothetical protein [Cryptosporangium arvum]